MTQGQETKLKSYHTIAALFLQNQEVVRASTGFVMAVHAFRCCISGIRSLHLLTETIIHKKTEGLSGSRFLLIQQAQDIRATLHDYKLGVVDSAPGFPQGLSSLTDQQLISSAILYAEELEDNLPKLSVYGVNTSILCAYNITIENFMGIAPSLSNIMSNGEAYTLCLHNLFRNAHTILKEQLDGMMHARKNLHPAFFEEYWTERLLV